MADDLNDMDGEEYPDDDMWYSPDGSDDEEWRRDQREHFEALAELGLAVDKDEFEDDGVANTTFSGFYDQQKSAIRHLVFERGYTHTEVCQAYEGDCPEIWIASILADSSYAAQLVLNSAARERGEKIR